MLYRQGILKMQWRIRTLMGAVSKKIHFRPSGPQFGLKLRGAPGPFPGSATD